MKHLLCISLFPVILSANAVYIAQTVAGGATGADCADAMAVSYFNSAGSWNTTPTGIQIGPGTTVHLCGTIATALSVQGDGAAGNVITVIWETGARLSLPSGSLVAMNNHSYFLFDGGIPCGPATACDSVEAANLTGYAAGQAGIMENTANGSPSPFPNQFLSRAFDGCDGCHDIEIRNIIVRNLYQHTDSTDVSGAASSTTWIWSCSSGTTNGCGNGGASNALSFHDLTCHDVGNCIAIEKTNNTVIDAHHMDIYRCNWAGEISGDELGTQRVFLWHDNHMHDAINWDNPVSDCCHHNGIHSYIASGSGIKTLFYFYNNLSDGNWGNASTASMLFMQFDFPVLYAFNNVSVESANNVCPAAGGTMGTCGNNGDGETVLPFGAAGSQNGLFANNTTIGQPATGRNVEGYELGFTGSVVANNVTQGYGQYVVASAATSPLWDYNIYGPKGISGNKPWAYNAYTTTITTFAGATVGTDWQATCACDAHGSNPSNLTVAASGKQTAGSPLIGAGVNLCNGVVSCTGYLAPLAYATTYGGQIAAVARPSSAAWDAGAYQYSTPSGATWGGNVTLGGSAVVK